MIMPEEGFDPGPDFETDLFWDCDYGWDFEDDHTEEDDDE